MPTIQIRDVPQKVYDKLVAQAKSDRRSITQQALYILEQSLFVEIEGNRRKKEVLEKIKRSKKKWSHLRDPVGLIREDRDSMNR